MGLSKSKGKSFYQMQSVLGREIPVPLSILEKYDNLTNKERVEILEELKALANEGRPVSKVKAEATLIRAFDLGMHERKWEYIDEVVPGMTTTINVPEAIKGYAERFQVNLPGPANS